MAESPEQSTSWGSILAGLAVGAIAGAAVALLYAPKSGKETRDDLLERLDQMKSRVDETAQRMRDAARARLSEARSDISEAMDAGLSAARSRAEDLRHKAGLE
jgi:gas vesicle protein